MQNLVTQGFMCYRVCFMSKCEVDDLEKNIGSYIKIEGFMSTSLNEEFIKSTKGNCRFNVFVPRCRK